MPGWPVPIDALGEADPPPGTAEQPAGSGIQAKSTRYPARGASTSPSLPASFPVAGPDEGLGAGSSVAGSPAVWKATRMRPVSVPVTPVTVTEPGPPSWQPRPETLVTVNEP
ncbi:hypothetical protein [Kitasatospora putterlickiae]|uniref:hypothetical protein n=1 Tax=Kitasatospora putterlickiae TaxID=221725 RepID=UPI0031DD66D5